jgi:DNA transformation protein
MAVTSGFRAFVVEQLQVAGPVTARAMFGGLGLYCEGCFFALVADDTLYLKVDDVTRPAFERAGSGPFRPYGGHQVMQYYEIPPEVLEDRMALREWARAAIAVARRKGRGKSDAKGGRGSGSTRKRATGKRKAGKSTKRAT